MANSDVASVARKLLPILDWIPAYRREWLLPDVLAGAALWAVMVPETMAYAGIVGVPPIMGLYTIVPALLAYALLGTSRQLVVGPDTATGLISAVTVGAVATQGTAEFNTLTSTLAVLIGIFFFSFGVMRMGWVASFISTPVMRGFIEGLVYVTIIGQVPHLLGIGGASGNFFTKVWNVLQHLSDVSVGPVVTGILSLTAMLFLRYLAPAVPAALVVMAAATILIGLLGGETTGVHVAGHIPSGLPHLTSPNLDATILYELAPGALAIVLVGYAEALGAAKAAAMQGGGDINPNQELVAHGPANILSGLFGGFLVVGSLLPLHANSADAFVPKHAAAGARRHCHCCNVASHEAQVLTGPVRPKPLVVCQRGDCHRCGTDVGRAARYRLGRRVGATDLDLPDQPSARRSARPTTGHRGLSRCPASSRGHYFSGIANLANRRRSLLLEHRSRGRGVESVAGCAAGREAGASGLQSGQLHRHQCKRRVVKPHQRAKKPRFHPCLCARARRCPRRYAARWDRGCCGPAQLL